MPCKGSMRNFNFCLHTVKEKEGYDRDTAGKVCGKIQQNIDKDEHELSAAQQCPSSEWTSLKCPCKKSKDTELKEGIKAEKEHAKTLESLGVPKEKVKEAEKKIAEDHLTEQPDYYARLEQMEAPDFWMRLKIQKPPVTFKKADTTRITPKDEKEIRNLRLKSQLSPAIHDLKEVQEALNKDSSKEWNINLEELLRSEREFSGTFHKPVIDKEDDIIPVSAMDEAMSDYMILPAICEVHTERVIGIIVKVWRNGEDEYKFLGKIKPTHDCDDVWKKIQKGEYDGLSIGGKRIKFSHECSIPSGIRPSPCVTQKLDVFNVSVCSKPVNPEATVDAIAKSEDLLVFDLTRNFITQEPTHITKGGNMGDTDVSAIDKGEYITKSDISELTKAITGLQKSFESHFESLTTPHPQHIQGKEHSTENTMHKDEDPDPDPDPRKRVRKDEDPDEDPGRRMKKDEGPDPDPGRGRRVKKDEDPDPDPKRMRKSSDYIGSDEVSTLRKSFDAVISERDEYIAALEERLNGMEKKFDETVVRKGGQPVIIPEEMKEGDPLATSNMALIQALGRTAE